MGCRVLEGALLMSRYQSPPPKPSTPPSPAKVPSPGSTPPRRARLLSSKSAAEYLGISPNSIRKLVADGKLSAYFIGAKKLVKFDPEDVDAYLAKCRVENS